MAVGEDRCGLCTCGCVVAEVEVADCGSEDGLDGVQEDGELEEFGGGSRAVGGRCKALLEQCPCQTIQILAFYTNWQIESLDN